MLYIAGCSWVVFDVIHTISDTFYTKDVQKVFVFHCTVRHTYITVLWRQKMSHLALAELRLAQPAVTRIGGEKWAVKIVKNHQHEEKRTKINLQIIMG